MIVSGVSDEKVDLSESAVLQRILKESPDNLRAAAALGSAIDRFVDGGELTDQAYRGLGFYAPVFFPLWRRRKSRQEILDEALTWASRNNQCESMARLVSLGANVNANPFRGTPLGWAEFGGAKKAVELLQHK